MSLLTRKNQSGDRVLQGKTVGEDNLKMMMALAWGVVTVSNRPELFPAVRVGILNLGDYDFIQKSKPPTCCLVVKYVDKYVDG